MLYQVEFDSPEPALPGFPVERALVLVTNTDTPVSLPVGPERVWRHRYPQVSLETFVREPPGAFSQSSLFGGLCLWLPNDIEPLRWSWARGFDHYVRILQRHLWLEEYFRRYGLWLVEDAPHGWPTTDRPFPIFSEGLRNAS